MGESEFLDELFDKKILNVIKFFLDRPEEVYYLRELSKKTRTSLATTFRIVNKLVKLNILDEVYMKKFKVYRLARNERVELLDQFIATKRSAISEFIKMVSDVPEIVQILLHGEEGSDKSSLLVIGQGVPAEKLNAAASEIQYKYNYKIIFLTLDPAQFEQMTSMGLYPGKKQVLFQK